MNYKDFTENFPSRFRSHMAEHGQGYIGLSVILVIVGLFWWSPFEQPYDKWRGCKYALELTRWEKRFESYGDVIVTSRELGRVTGLRFSFVPEKYLPQLLEFKEDLQYVRELSFDSTEISIYTLISFDFMWRLDSIEIGDSFASWGNDLARLKVFPNLKHVGLGYGISDDDALKAIASIDTVESLSFHRHEPIGEQSFSYLQKMSNLKRLEISFSHDWNQTLGNESPVFTDIGLNALVNMTSLTKLTLEDYSDFGENPAIGFTKQAWERFLKNDKWEELGFHNMTGLTDTVLIDLALLPNLKSLELSGCLRSDSAVSTLATSLARNETIETIIIISNEWQPEQVFRVTDEFLGKLKENKTIKFLDIELHEDASMACLQYVAEMEQLEDLYIGSDAIDFTKEELDELQNALPNCFIWLNGTGKTILSSRLENRHIE
jgi:hypothetical protein